MTRDWTKVGLVRRDILSRMNEYGDNIAVIPFAEYLEKTDRLMWMVDIHIHIKKFTEFTIHGEGFTLSSALRQAYLGLNNKPAILRKAKTANERFGVAV